MKQKIKSILQEITTDITGTIGISVIEIQTGMSLASITNRESFDLDTAAAYNAEVVKQKKKAMVALELVDEELEDFTITLTSQIHIINFINTDFMLYFAVDRSKTNLAMAKVILKKSNVRLKEAIESI